MNVGKLKVRIQIFNKYNGKCAYCGDNLDKARFCIDHIKPIFRGSSFKEKEQLNQQGILGNNNVSNLNPCCFSCNSSKSTHPLEKWREEIRLKVERINRDSSRYRILKRFSLVKETKKSVTFYFERHV